MTSRARSISFIALVAVLAALWVPPSRADHDDGLYELPSIAQWGKSHLVVHIVPPAHGQVFNFETGTLNGNDEAELTPFNSYLEAIEAAIGAWETAVQRFGQPWLREAFEVDVYVLGRDVPPAGVRPDILVVTDENDPSNLGVAVRVIPCVVKMDKFDIVSLTYADMYNVTAQEFGHCLGLRHVGSQGGVDPLSDLKHPEHDVMNGFYTHPVGFEGTHLHCISNLNVLALEYVFSTAYAGLLPSGGPSSISFMPVDAYGTTCEPPPSDWRTKVPDGGTFQPAPDPTSEPGEPGDTPGSAEPDAVTVIDEPAQGEDRHSLRRVSGTSSWSGEGDAKVFVALLRKAKGACSWWDASRNRMVGGSCDSFLWNEASGIDDWRLRIPKGASLPRGRYKALARTTVGDFREECCEMGRNMIDFRLL